MTEAAPPDAVALYAAHRLGLTRLAVLLVDDLPSAEDVVQDAFAGFLGKVGRLDDPDKALAYLRTAVVNNARSALRRRRTARAYVVPREVPVEDPSGRAVLRSSPDRRVDRTGSRESTLACSSSAGTAGSAPSLGRHWSPGR